MAPFIKSKKTKHSSVVPKSIFLGDYFKWDPHKTYKIAKKFGFKKISKPKTGSYNYADIDDDLISIHHYLKIYKFGFSRNFDNLSLEIRNNRLSRNKAVKIVKKDLFKPPKEDIKKFCKLINIGEKKFFQICEKFRNKKIWNKINGKWKLKKPLA